MLLSDSARMPTTCGSFRPCGSHGGSRRLTGAAIHVRPFQCSTLVAVNPQTSRSLSALPPEMFLPIRDHVCPLHHAQYVASTLPNATLTVRRGGHLLVLRAAEEALRALIA